MTHTIAGYKEANDRKDPRLLDFAVEMDLILVDGLETFFQAHSPRRYAFGAPVPGKPGGFRTRTAFIRKNNAHITG